MIDERRQAYLVGAPARFLFLLINVNIDCSLSSQQAAPPCLSSHTM